MNSLRTKWKGYERTDDVAAFVDRALAELRPAALILFGSLAKGDYHQSSDADLCVVLPQPEADFRRDGLRVSELDATGGVEAVVFGRDQFLRTVGQGNGLALEILHWGVVLGGDPVYLETLAAAWREAWTALGLEKTPTGWRVGRPAGPAGVSTAGLYCLRAGVRMVATETRLAPTNRRPPGEDSARNIQRAAR